MKKSDLVASVAIVEAIMREAPLLARDRQSLYSANLRRRCGELFASAKAIVLSGSVGRPMLEVMALAEDAGADMPAFDRLRRFATELPYRGEVATAIYHMVVRICLAWQCRAVSRTSFKSHQEAEAIQLALNGAFDIETDAAAAEADPENFRSLVALHAAVTEDLSARARLLPRVVRYDMPARLPALSIAHRLYIDAGRAEDLMARNRAVHPLFMPASGQALAR